MLKGLFRGRGLLVISLTLLAVALVLVVAFLVLGRSWQAEVIGPDGVPLAVDAKVLESLDDPDEEDLGVPVDYLLWSAGYQVVDRVTVTGPGGARREFEWPAVADDAWWLANGKLSIAGETLAVSRLDVEPSAQVRQVRASITDMAPTAAAALGLPPLTQATGRPLQAVSARHVLILLLDGLGYQHYVEARQEGLTPNLAALGEPLLGLTTYPPVTSVSMASLLTGAPSQVHGAWRRGIRQTEVETLFDAASAAGLYVVTVEGESLPFNLRNAEIRLSGDRDGNGSTDDNVLANALAALDAGMPDLLYVHFHGIDDAEHIYSPGAPEVSVAVRDMDSAVGQIVSALPHNTLVLILADHGQHLVAADEEGRVGNHGSLIGSDMFIPIWVIEK
jgi:Type I phosphodiesterase / nucleotide pyrophosphatase